MSDIFSGLHATRRESRIKILLIDYFNLKNNSNCSLDFVQQYFLPNLTDCFTVLKELKP